MYPLFNVRERRGVQSLAHWHWQSTAVTVAAQAGAGSHGVTVVK